MFWATEKLTVVALLPVIVIHGAVEFGVQVQPLPVVTVKLPVPPEAVKVWLAGLMLKVQPAAWVTVKV